MEMKDLKSYMGKYAEIALYDDGAGTAEIIDVNEEKIKLMWVQYTSCYDCQESLKNDVDIFRRYYAL